MAWHPPGNKPSCEPVMVSLLRHICIIWPQWANSSSAECCWELFHTNHKMYQVWCKSYLTCVSHPVQKCFKVKWKQQSQHHAHNFSLVIELSPKHSFDFNASEDAKNMSKNIIMLHLWCFDAWTFHFCSILTELILMPFIWLSVFTLSDYLHIRTLSSCIYICTEQYDSFMSVTASIYYKLPLGCYSVGYPLEFYLQLKSLARNPSVCCQIISSNHFDSRNGVMNQPDFEFKMYLTQGISCIGTVYRKPPIEECCARNRYQGQGQVITSHIICGMQLLVPAPDTCFWHNTTQLCVGCNYLSLPLIPVSGTTLLNCVWDVITCPCPWYLFLAQHSSIVCGM